MKKYILAVFLLTSFIAIDGTKEGKYQSGFEQSGEAVGKCLNFFGRRFMSCFVVESGDRKIK